MKPAVLLPLLLSACIAIPIPVPSKSQRPPQQIYGQWQITEINRRAVEALDINLRIFSINPQFSARTDCNQLFGHYTAGDNHSLTFHDIAATRMACPNMLIERQLAKTLPQVQSYRIQGRHLELLVSEGKRIVRAKVGTSDTDTAEH